MRIKLDNRIRTIIDNGIVSRHRSMFIIIGDKARDQIVTLHHILLKANGSSHPSVLWCYKKELEFSSHRKKRMKEIKKKKEAGVLKIKEENLFEQFILTTHIRYCYYSDTQNILGNTFGMLILQDFEALTPNLLARTIETVEGGGIIIFLIQNVNSLKQLYTLTMDVHKRYRTEAHTDIVARFNERFILSLATCPSCIIMDDCLNVLPLSSVVSTVTPICNTRKNAKSEELLQLQQLQKAMADTKPIGPLLNKCVTYCQAKVLLHLLDAASDKSLNTICSITAARGRGKSAALGLAIAGAIGFGFTNIFVTSPSVENLKIMFEFVVKGFEAIGYQEHADFDIIKSMDPALDKCVVRINVFRRHRQNIQYIHPTDAVKLVQAELLVIDEAAAIPIPLLKKLLSNLYLVFLASTTSGYEGTGRSLSIKLMEQLRRQSELNENEGKGKGTGTQHRRLFELSLEESIRYGNDDPVEEWLNRTLCLNSQGLKNTISSTPSPEKCELYYVNRDALFSYHKASEIFLANLMSIYVAAHYKNTPDDLQLLSDAPAHHIFALMAPISSNEISIPQILAVIQICLEGEISTQTVINTQEKGKRAAGDVIPWTLCQQFLDSDFPHLAGARIVRIAVHPDFQGMGYGSRAIQLLQQYYRGKLNQIGLTMNKNGNEVKELTKKCSEMMEIDEDCQFVNEELIPRINIPPLLQRLQERPVESLDYIGASFGLTLPLLKFWKRHEFIPVYIRHKANDLTGEHTCIVVNVIPTEADDHDQGQILLTKNSDGTWLPAYFTEFRKRLIPLLGIHFNKFTPHLAFSLLFMNKNMEMTRWNINKNITREGLRFLISDLDLKRLSHYAKNLADHHLVSDLLPKIAGLYFNGQMGSNVSLDLTQAAILLGVGLQGKGVDETANELGLPVSQGYALLNKAIRRLSEYLDTLCRDALVKETEEAKRAPKEIPEPDSKKMRVSYFK